MLLYQKCTTIRLLIQYMHATLHSPRKSMFLQAIKMVILLDGQASHLSMRVNISQKLQQRHMDQEHQDL